VIPVAQAARRRKRANSDVLNHWEFNSPIAGIVVLKKKGIYHMWGEIGKIATKPGRGKRINLMGQVIFHLFGKILISKDPPTGQQLGYGHKSTARRRSW